jgi:hypothetical protein
VNDLFGGCFRPFRYSPSMAGLGRTLPNRVRLGNVRFQYVPDLQVYFVNVRYVGNTSHPSKLLRHFPVKGRNAPVTHPSQDQSGGQLCRNFGPSYYLRVHRLPAITRPSACNLRRCQVFFSSVRKATSEPLTSEKQPSLNHRKFPGFPVKIVCSNTCYFAHFIPVTHIAIFT